MRPTRRHSCLPVIAILMIALWMVAPHSTAAQAVRPEITVSHPAPDVAMLVERWLQSGRPRIAIHRPDMLSAGADTKPVRSARIRDAVTAWELLLLGLGVPYTVVGDEILGDGPDRSIDVLVMPAAAQADEATMRNAGRFVRSGGGLVASGAPATDTPASELLEDLLGARFVPLTVPVAGLYQALDRLPTLQTGVSAGVRLNVAVYGSFQPVRPTDSNVSMELGPLIPYGSDSTNALDGLTGAIQASPGQGRVIWTAFMPQDVSGAPDQQLAWQRFALGALGNAGGLPVLSVELWPAASRASLGIAVLPSPGHDPSTMLRNMEHLLDFLEGEDLPATFYLPGSDVHSFPDLVRRMDAAGDFGATTRSGHPLRGQPADVQRARVREGLADVPSGKESAGFLPPGNLVDGATLQAVAVEGLDFVLQAGGRSHMPDSAAIHELVDFREANNRQFVRTMPLGGTVGSSGHSAKDDYEVVQSAGGLFVAPFRVEEITPGSARFDAFADLIHRARRDGTAILSLSNALNWVDARSQIRIELRGTGDDEAIATVTNAGDATVSNLVLRWNAGRTAPLPSVDVDGSESDIAVRSDPATGTTLLVLPDLVPGATLEISLSLP